MYIHSAILLSAVHPGRSTLYSRILHVRLKILIAISHLMTNYCNRRIREVLCGAAAVLLCAGAFSCGKENDESQGGDAPHEGRARTVLVYMIGDVNLWQEQWTNLNRLEAGWNDDIDGNLLVYLDPSPHTTQFPNPVLLEIVPQKLSGAERDRQSGDARRTRRRDPDVSGPVAGARDRIARFGLVARFRRRVGAHG